MPTDCARVLVIDDEAVLRTLLRDMLSACGYDADVAEDGAAGLERYRSQRYNAVITDLLMPVVDGHATILVLKKINPQVRIVAVSGATRADSVARAALAGVKHYLAKPYSAGTLLTVLRDVLQKAPTA